MLARTVKCNSVVLYIIYLLESVETDAFYLVLQSSFSVWWIILLYHCIRDIGVDHLDTQVIRKQSCAFTSEHL